MVDARRTIEEAEGAQHSIRAVGEIDSLRASRTGSQHETFASPCRRDHGRAHTGRLGAGVRLVDQRGDVVQRVGQRDLNGLATDEEFSGEVEGGRTVRLRVTGDFLASGEL